MMNSSNISIQHTPQLTGLPGALIVTPADTSALASPVMVQASFNHIDPEIRAWQLRRKPSVTTTTTTTTITTTHHSGAMAMTKAAASTSTMASNEPHTLKLLRVARAGKLEAFLKEAALTDLSKSTRQVLLTTAAAQGLSDLTRLLLGMGDINPSHVQSDDDTALRAAIRHGHLDIVMLLLKAGVNTTTPSATGETAFMHACRHGQTDIAIMLAKLLSKKDLLATDHLGCSLLDYAVLTNSAKLVMSIASAVLPLEKSLGMQAMMTAANDGKAASIEALCAAGVSPNAENVYGIDALKCAAAKQHVEAVKILLDLGAKLAADAITGKNALEHLIQNYIDKPDEKSLEIISAVLYGPQQKIVLSVENFTLLRVLRHTPGGHVLQAALQTKKFRDYNGRHLN